MPNDPNKLDYAIPPRPPPRPSARIGFPSWLGLVYAFGAVVVAQFIWMTGVLGNAHRDDVAMILLLSLGAIAAFAGCVSGFAAFVRYDPATPATVRQGAGCLFAILDLVACCILVFAVLGILGRMY